MPGKPQPLVNNQPIVKDGGLPTDYFIRWAQQRQIDIAGGITAAEAQQLIVDYLAARSVLAGTGLSGGGTLDADVTLALNAVLGNLNDVDVLTVPPVTGSVLTYDGADLMWKPGTGGGGGAYTKIDQVRLSAPGSVTFVAIPQIYDDLIIVYSVGATTVNAATRLHLQMNLDTGNNYDWEYWNRYGNVGPTYATNAIAFDEIPPQKTSGGLEGTKNGTIELIDYRGTRAPKLASSVSGMRYVPSGGFGADLFGSVATGCWNNAAAITDLTLTASVNALDTGSVVTLYGRG